MTLTEFIETMVPILRAAGCELAFYSTGSTKWVTIYGPERGEVAREIFVMDDQTFEWVHRPGNDSPRWQELETIRNMDLYVVGCGGI